MRKRRGGKSTIVYMKEMKKQEKKEQEKDCAEKGTSKSKMQCAATVQSEGVEFEL